MKTICRGDIYYADLRPVVGSEQGGVRPVVVLQNNVGNRHSPTVIVAAITSSTHKARLPTHVQVGDSPGRLYRNSIVLLEQVRTIDRARLREHIGALDEAEMARIDTPEDANGNLKAQEKMLWDFASKQGYEVAGTTCDLGFAINTNGAGLSRVMQAAEAKDFSVLLVSRLDRINWDTEKAMEFLTALQLNGVSLCTLADGELDISEQLRELFGKLPAFPEQTQDEPMESGDDLTLCFNR